MALTENPPAGGDASASAPLLDVQNLTVEFRRGRSVKQVITGLSYAIAPGETLGVVGESGCGKSMTALALLGLVPYRGHVGGRILFRGTDLVSQPASRMRRMRGHRIAMIFQEPMSALNPVMTVGRQIGEVMEQHFHMPAREANEKAIDLLAQVGIPSPHRRAQDYPHHMSGGMRQRAMIAMALACRPSLLVADEPTTALDVTIQAQILDLMIRLQDEIGMSIQFISHNLAVISEISDSILVMYAGRAVEYTSAEKLFASPLHPYTRGLIATLPDPRNRVDRLPVIPGSVPSNIAMLGQGCRFAQRCPLATDVCRSADPPLEEVRPGHHVACYRALE